MTVARKRRPSVANLHRCRMDYVAELARGSSYIASMLSPASQQAAIAETVGEFALQYGTQDISAFVELLARCLEERQQHGAAAAVRRQRV